MNDNSLLMPVYMNFWVIVKIGNISCKMLLGLIRDIDVILTRAVSSKIILCYEHAMLHSDKALVHGASEVKQTLDNESVLFPFH